MYLYWSLMPVWKRVALVGGSGGEKRGVGFLIL